MADLSDLILTDPSGSPVRLGTAVDRTTVIVLVRYYGCPPCRAFLGELAARSADLQDAGAAALGVGPRAAYQARGLRERRGIGFPLLLDPDHAVGRAVGMPRQSLLRFVFDLRGWRRWLRSLSAARQGLVTGGWWELPAVLVVDGRCRVVWAYRGRFLGDYPPVDEVLEVARGVPES